MRYYSIIFFSCFFPFSLISCISFSVLSACSDENAISLAFRFLNSLIRSSSIVIF